jgi:hypothetical protein
LLTESAESVQEHLIPATAKHSNTYTSTVAFIINTHSYINHLLQKYAHLYVHKPLLVLGLCQSGANVLVYVHFDRTYSNILHQWLGKRMPFHRNVGGYSGGATREIMVSTTLATEEATHKAKQELQANVPPVKDTDTPVVKTDVDQPASVTQDGAPTITTPGLRSRAWSVTAHKHPLEELSPTGELKETDGEDIVTTTSGELHNMAALPDQSNASSRVPNFSSSSHQKQDAKTPEPNVCGADSLAHLSTAFFFYFNFLQRCIRMR